MIGVKGVRATQGKPIEADRFEVAGLSAASRIPALLLALTGGVALYLRSFLPVWAETGLPAHPVQAGLQAEADASPSQEKGDIASVAAVPDSPVERTGPSPEFEAEEEPHRSEMPQITGLSDDMFLLPGRGETFAAPPKASNMNLPPPMPGGVRDPAPLAERPDVQFPGLATFNENPVLELLPAGIRLPARTGAASLDVDDSAPDRNRAPANRGPVYLADVATSAVLMIGLSDLLRHTVDPDGDRLAVTEISASSGTISRVSGGFRYVPAPDHIGPVTVTLIVSDGQALVRQTAFLTVTERPLSGTDGDDILLGSLQADAIDGRDGDDNIVARGGDDLIEGGFGDDHIVAGAGNDIVRGGDGNDLIFGGAGNDVLSGGKGDDRLYGDDGDDVLFGDVGDDDLHGGSGTDFLAGGAGNDRLFGEAGDDRLAAGEGADLLSGGDGADMLLGETGDDTLIGGAGADSLLGGDGDDHIVGGTGADVLDAGPGDDHLEGNDGADWLAGQDGNDRLEGGAGQDSLLAGSGDDRLLGGEGTDHLDGGTGNDILEDGADADVVWAGIGNDIVIAHIDLSDDSYAGGDGSDELDYSGAAHDLLIDMAENLAMGLDIGTDSISGFESFVGGGGSDRFIASSEPARFKGGEGDDIFDFSQGLNQASLFELAYQILDFGVGDRVRVSRYDLFEDTADEISDELEGIYDERAAVQSREDVRIRYRHDQTDDFERTLIDFDLDMDASIEMTVALHGHHLLLLVEQG